MKEEILKHLLKCYPEEGCGVIIDGGTWIPCENVAEDKHIKFEISSKDYLKAALMGNITAIVHSHPNESCEPSEADKKISDHLQIPYHIYSIPEGDHFVYEPEKKSENLIGRSFNHEYYNCWSFVRDYYLQKLNIKLPVIPFEEDFDSKGIKYFETLFDKWGFYEVDTPQINDLILFKVRSNVENHAGVYVGNQMFIHQAENQLSREELLDSLWLKYRSRFLRCKQFI